MSRRSYRGLMGLTAFGLYERDGRLVATIRTHHEFAALRLFEKHHIPTQGREIRPVEKEDSA